MNELYIVNKDCLGRPCFVVLQLEYQPKTNTGHLKLPFVFCWSINHLVYYSSLHIYRFDAVCKSVQYDKLYQGFLRYQEMNLKLHRKHLEFHD